MTNITKLNHQPKNKKDLCKPVSVAKSGYVGFLCISLFVSITEKGKYISWKEN